MLLRRVASVDDWVEVAAGQRGLIGRAQLLELGLTPAQARTNVANGRWQRVHPGVYATFTGAVDPTALVWAALLYAGAGAVACCSTALWLHRVLDRPPDVVQVSIPHSRRVDRHPGIRMHRRRPLDRARPPILTAANPPRMRVEQAVLDVCADGTETDAVGVLLRATQRRVTTAGRIAGALSERPIQRHRTLINDILAEARAGVASPLELRYRRDVEVPHGLPAGRRNRAEPVGLGGTRYRDVEYEAWSVIVELDGREAHPADEMFRDMRRDNDAAISGRTTLRFGWRDVVGERCVVAGQVGLLLQRQGWRGPIGRCGPECLIPRGPGPS